MFRSKIVFLYQEYMYVLVAGLVKKRLKPTFGYETPSIKGSYANGMTFAGIT
jgi:hypothetical protein